MYLLFILHFKTTATFFKSKVTSSIISQHLSFSRLLYGILSPNIINIIGERDISVSYWSLAVGYTSGHSY
jgi:hypothetical protein